MPSLQNITATATWVTPLPVPEDGAEITADANDGMTQGPVNPGFQGLMDRDKALAQGVVTIKAITVDGVGEQAAAPIAGDITASHDIECTNDLRVGRNASVDQQLTVLDSVVVNNNGISTTDGAGTAWTSVGTASDEGNPPRTTALSNKLRPVNTPKAWARFRCPGDGSLVFLDGAGITTAACVLGTSYVAVTMAQNMADTNYCVVANGIDGTSPQNPAMYPTFGADATKRPTVSAFYLLFPGGFRPDTTEVECCFHVMGRQTT